jgi:hypothetical protein
LVRDTWEIIESGAKIKTLIIGSSYLVLVDIPKEYNNINAIIDFFEFLFRLYKTKMLDKELWDRWKASAKSTMSIPKIKKVWDKTKDIHTHEFVKFIESL